MRFRSAKKTLPPPMSKGKIAVQKSDQPRKCRKNPSMAPILAMVNRPAIARAWVSTENGTMAAAKMKNVEAPALKGKYTTPNSTMPPM